MITLRPMRPEKEDYLLMQRWFMEPGLQKWVWCDAPGEGVVPLSRIAEKYGSRALHPTDVFPYFIECQGRPIGFIQYYLSDAASIGLDMWIGEAEYRGRGLGTQALWQMTRLIAQKHPEMSRLFIDPHPENGAAIRCYEKAGFRIAGEMMDDGEKCLLMEMQLDR